MAHSGQKSGSGEGQECGTPFSGQSKFHPTHRMANSTFSCRCGASVRAEHKFCHNCREPVQLIKEVECPPNFCCGELPDGTVCGFALMQSLNFCPNCGTRISGQQQSTARPDSDEPKTDQCSHTSSGATASASQDHLDNAEQSGSCGASEQRPQLFSQYADMKWTSQEKVTEKCMISNIRVEQDQKQQSSNLAQIATLQQTLKDPVTVSDPCAVNRNVCTSKEHSSDGKTETDITSGQTCSESAPKGDNAGNGDRPTEERSALNDPGNRRPAMAMSSNSKGAGSNFTTHPLMENRETVPVQEEGDAASKTEDGGYKEETEQSEKQPSEQRKKGDSMKGKEDRGKGRTGQKSDEKSVDNENNNKSEEGARGGTDASNKVENEGERMKTRSSSKQNKNMSYTGVVKEGPGGQKDKNGKVAAESPKTNNNTLLSAEEKVGVVFHVIVSEKFKVDPNSDTVCIRFEPKLLGGFTPDADRHRLKFIRSTDIGLVYEGKVIMAKSLRNNGFLYKYVVRRQDTDKPEWEYVLKRATSPYVKQAEFNRRFLVLDKERSFAGDWHRYDGIAYPEIKEDFWHSLRSKGKEALHKLGMEAMKSFPAKIREEALAAGKEFLPAVEDIQKLFLALEASSSQKGRAEELLKNVESVMSSLRLQMLDEKLESTDPLLVKTCIRETLVAPVLESLEGALKEGTKRTVALAMFVWLLVQKHQILISPASVSQLCRAMLILPDMKNRVCPDLTDLDMHFPVQMKNRSTVAQAVVDLIIKSSDLKADPSWWCCIPLLHFLDGTSQPFQPLDPSPEFRMDNWWGILHFGRRKDIFKAHAQQTTGKLMDHIDLLHDAFAADAMLCRSVVACLNFDPLLPVLMKAPVSVLTLAATLCHHMRLRAYYKPFSQQLLGDVVRKMKVTLRQQSVREEAEQPLKVVKCQTIIIQELTEVMLKAELTIRNFDDAVLLDVINVLFLALDQWAVLEETLCREKGEHATQEWRQKANTAAHEICNCMDHTHTLTLLNFEREKLPEHLKMWGKLFRKTEDLDHAALKQHLEQLITQRFESTVARLPADDKLEVYLNQMDQVVPAFTGILNRLAFASLEEALKQGSSHVQENNVRLVSLLSTMLEQKWTQMSRTQDIFTFVVTWVPMDNYLQRFRDKQSIERLTEVARQIIEKGMSSINTTLKELAEGTIPVHILQFVLYQHERYMSVMAAAGHSKDRTQHLLALRGHELQAFTLMSHHIDKLFSHCGVLLRTGDFEEVHGHVEEQRKTFSKSPLKDVVQVSSLDSLKNLAHYKPISNPWQLTEAILTILPQLEVRISSLIFRKMFSRTGERMNLEKATFWRAFQSVWNEVSQQWMLLCDSMQDGSISLFNTEKLFRIYRGDQGAYNFSEMAADLRKMATRGTIDWVDKRIHQFKCYMDIKKHVAAASALLDVKKAYDIEGNFRDIEKICSLSQNASQPIGNLDESMLELCHQLEGVSTRNIRCLTDLVQPRCVQFVQWLKENMKDGLKELNVFVDLAFISAGEEPMSIARVNCFHAAATGYAPLIFTELSGGCEQLLKQCQMVFDNVTADPKLPQKLADTVHWLDWFKEVQKSHGSVEKTSLSQVANINGRGVFRLGRGNSTGLILDDVIRLTVCEDEAGKTPARSYTYEELLDLQSRLMLVAGQAEKGKENVDRFIIIMESLIRLGKTYVQLCNDGCVLFLDWTVEFLCDVERPVCCVSEFAREGKLKGHRSMQHDLSGDKREDVEEFIGGVAGFLERCQRHWMSYVDQKRQEFPELNIYTVEQLVFLQKQLVQVGSALLDKQVYPMLSLLKTACSPEDVEQALHEAMDQVDAMCHPHEPQHAPLAEEPPVPEGEKEAAFVEEILKSGFSRSMALQALNEVGAEDAAEGIAWCMKQEEDMDELKEERSGSEEEEEVVEERGEEGGRVEVGQRLKSWISRPHTITQSAIQCLQDMEHREDEAHLSWLTGRLESVWQQFVNTVSTSGSDFLSLQHLAVFLKCLAAKDEREFNRCLPPNLKSGMPNLILCPKNEVLNAVTYMYMFPQDSESLLPQPDEVLLCTPDTTFEQVDIFVRRAFFGSQKKVHCLGFADSLDYEVGEKAEKKIKEYTTMAGGDAYQLVVVCTSENEYRARIVASLEKFRRPCPALHTASCVHAYLRSRFAAPCKKGERTSASVLDPEGLCVRVIKSSRSGVGKTLYKHRLESRLKRCLPTETKATSITIPLHGRTVHTSDIAACLLKHTLDPGTVLPRILHLDVSYQVQEGVDHLLYNLLVLGCVQDTHGQVWLRSPMDLYLVEAMPLVDQKDSQKSPVLVHQIFSVLPTVHCWSPVDSLRIMKNAKSVPDYQPHDSLFDDTEYKSEVYQRPYAYLHKLDSGGQDMQTPDRNKLHCLTMLLKYCGVGNPSWSELTHFACFLNKQLQDFENSVYCGMATSQDLPGFSLFVLRFLIQMSRDFATRSLKMSEESLSALETEEDGNDDVQQYEMRRTWESSPHPYIFFNPDKNSMTFLGFSIDPGTGNLLDQQTGQMLEQGILTRQLYQALTLNRVPLNENFDSLPRQDRLLRLYRVLGLHDDEIFVGRDRVIDPDSTYELTTDNVKKILAIYMRFRCNIPVIVMGETGCGKTRLVKFLCALQTPHHRKVNTMVLVKVHGGTTGQDIIHKVRQAETLAKKNAALAAHRPVYTVLFFDEANTTEAIGVIKEVMCDGTLNGEPVSLSNSLKMVAACNPYRKHSDDLIERLENAGLGYHVDADKTVDKLGRVPMRRLVYRVQPLPQSMLPLVWDFGQLNTGVEALYILQMVRRYVSSGQLRDLDEAGMQVLCNLLMESQEFMRQLKDECSFVSLRDVDRALRVTSWFLQQAETSGVLFNLLNEKLHPSVEEEDGTTSQDSEWVEEEEEEIQVSDMTQAVVLALGVCYRACVRSKEKYDRHIIRYFQPPFILPTTDHFALIIDSCQEVFLDNVRLEDNIARNQALKENVFMMVVCIELRIPLFLVGKPGSSKSLAKTIVSDAMQGNFAAFELFKILKQAKMVSFQCSPLATAEGIVGMFRQCAQVQREKNLENFVSVVVLDEVGLAEDSPKMPLKTLHPLLEDGCPGDEAPEDSKKVGFIGISNWALDPAKMNRGILVQRDVPDEEELTDTARGICDTQDERTVLNMKTLIPPLAQAYLSIFKDAKLKREFFGLRDFYSLVKMVYTFAARSKRIPSHCQLVAAVRRNFGGLDTVDPVESFRKHLPASVWEEQARDDDPDCTASGLIKAALSGDDMGGDSRYLLLLTENYGGLSILSENLLADQRAVPIFGSSFPKDQEYTQICRNINRIKVCMEMGQTVILLNLENLYESLYDALNQYYAMFGGERYVDLGLGTHRVKCRVHRQFRLIMVAEKQVVYDKFPIPLINRLEKHFLTLNNIMSPQQLALAQALHTWAQRFVTQPSAGPITRLRAREAKKESVGDAFMGYHPDTAPAIVVKVWDVLQVDSAHVPQQQIMEECQQMLLWCATPDAVVRSQDPHWGRVYQQEQQHEHLQQYLLHRLTQHSSSSAAAIMAQVTTHSKLLTEQERVDLCGCLPVSDITLLSLQSFDTEQQFCQQLRQFFGVGTEDPKLLIVQCDSGDSNQNLIKCAQYCLQDVRPDHGSQHHVVFIVQLPRVAGACFTGFLGGNWHCLHIDDLRSAERPVPPVTELQSRSPAQLILASLPVRTPVTPPHLPMDLLLDPPGDSSPDALLYPTGDASSPDSMQWEEDSLPRNAGVGEREEMDVDVSEVQIQMEPGPSPSPHPAHSKHDTRPQGFDPLFIKQLLLSSVQAAVAVVRDREEGALRATQRITALLHLIDDNETFFTGLVQLVGRLLEEREQCAFEAERWLLREAAKLESVKKAGTFRRAWVQSLENKLVPVLAGVIAYLDTNHNLDLLFPHMAEPRTPDTSFPEPAPGSGWVREMWLGMLQEACQVTYKQLCSMSGKEELEEFTVHHTGAGAAPVSARLPFSWLLWELVETAITSAKTIPGDLVQTAGSVVEQSTLCRCVSRYVAGSGDLLQHLFQLYIMDLLFFTFPLTSAQHKLLCVCVEKGLNQLDMDLVSMGLGAGLVVLHLLVEQSRPRLQAILDLAGVRPMAVEALTAWASATGAQLLSAHKEMTEDVALLRLVVEELQPRPSQFMEEQGCHSWVARYSAVAPVIVRILKEAEVMLTERQAGEGEEPSSISVLPYGELCTQQLLAVRCQWTRMTTVKLFFDFVGPLRQGPGKLRKALEHIKYQLLWTLLEDDADLKKVKTLKLVDKFLKHTNGFILRGLLGRIGKCSFCDKKFESAPVELPCKHLLCNSCYRDCNHGNQVETKCPECNLSVPADFDPSAAECQDREAVEQLGHYQRQVSGFLMALVSQLCFAGQEPPEPAAIRHIFGYITHRSKGKTLLQTKHMTVHDDLIDPTPVLRSFLLRLLLKHSEREVRGHLDEFLRNWQQLVEQQTQATALGPLSAMPTLLEFSLLVVHCREDLLHEQAALGGHDPCSEEQLQTLTNQLHTLQGTVDERNHALSTLYSLGFLRYALNTFTHILFTTFVAGRGAPVVTEDVQDLLRVVQAACRDTNSDWPRRFVIKQLCRGYGLQAYMTVRKVGHDLLTWLVFEESQDKVEEVADRYLICSPHYKGLRDALGRQKLSRDSQELKQVVQDLPFAMEMKETLLLLALHREITMSAVRQIPEEAYEQMVEAVTTFVQDCDVIQDKDLALQLCENQLGGVGCALFVHGHMDLEAQSLACILTHLKVALRPNLQPASPLLFPFRTLLLRPDAMANAYLPTMPQDNLEEILQGVGHSGAGSPALWCCPNGHRYIIGDCGNPVVVKDARCNICGSKIGGKATHVAEDHNRQLNKANADQTKTGHILGAAAQRGTEAVPERLLSPVETAVLRFLTHATLYLAASNIMQVGEVAGLVQPAIPEEEACPFFWDHLLHDLRVLGRAVSRSVDDVYLVMHHVCHLLATLQSGGEEARLTSKQQRAAWEREFTTLYITPAVQAIDEVVRRGNRVIVSDDRQGDSALLNMVYETQDSCTSPGHYQGIRDLHNSPSVWRYRPRISVEQFFRHFHLHVECRQHMKDKFPIISLFKQEYHIIHALHYMPAIMAGQRLLMNQLNRHLDRAEAVTEMVGDAMGRKECAGLSDLLENFSKAWDIVKEHLITYHCMTPMEGLVSLPEEFFNASISKQSPLAVLLPSTQGPGLCSYILLQFLLNRHNELLRQICPLIKHTYSALPEVTVHALTERHLVSCWPERDLLPLVLSHCNYSLMVGQAATLDYDFAAFQQQLADNFLQSKARIQRCPQGHFPVETMVYRADTTSARLFKALREKIEQECLSPAERRQIMEEMGNKLPDICRSIDNLNTALSFLKALGGSASTSLEVFMSSALKMKYTVCSHKAQQLCCLKHLQSLWIVFCFQRACILASHQQDAFDSVERQFCEDLTEEQEREVEMMCQQMSVDRLELLLLLLFECIMLRLSEPREQEDDTQPENYRLREVLQMSLEVPLYSSEPMELASGLLTSHHLHCVPDSLQGRHAAATWTLCQGLLARKRSG